MSTDKHRHSALQIWNGIVPWTYEGLQTALLAAILDELKSMNATLKCSSTQRIPRYLARIAANTTKKKRIKVAK